MHRVDKDIAGGSLHVAAGRGTGTAGGGSVEHTGDNLTGEGEGDDEEHLLLAMALGSARDAVTVSWQRADDEGKSKTASLALREIARLVHGRPDLRKVLKESRRVPAHPGAWLDALEKNPGLLSKGEEEILLALRSPSPEIAHAALGARGAGLDRGLRMLAVTESFELMTCVTVTVPTELNWPWASAASRPVSAAWNAFS